MIELTQSLRYMATIMPVSYTHLDVYKRQVQWDKNREIHYKKLNEKVQNQNQKNAIEQFKTTIEDAVLKRRSAFDMATQDYRSSIELTLNNKQNGVCLLYTSRCV